jgi:hypothetical protein
MRFAQARNSEYPPYLLDFCGTPGERHFSCSYVKQLIDPPWTGLAACNKAVALIHGPDHSWFRHLAERIQKHFIGPDCYWKNHVDSLVKDRLSNFGTTWWVPFPPTSGVAILVIWAYATQFVIYNIFAGVRYAKGTGNIVPSATQCLCGRGDWIGWANSGIEKFLFLIPFKISFTTVCKTSLHRYRSHHYQFNPDTVSHLTVIPGSIESLFP